MGASGQFDAWIPVFTGISDISACPHQDDCVRNDCKTGFRDLCEVLGLPDAPALIDRAALQRGGFLVAADPQRLHAQLEAAMSVCAERDDRLRTRLSLWPGRLG